MKRSEQITHSIPTRLFLSTAGASRVLRSMKGLRPLGHGFAELTVVLILDCAKTTPFRYDSGYFMTINATLQPSYDIILHFL